MKSRTIFALAAALPLASAVTPVQKVIELLEGMVKKGAAEKHDEEVEFAKFKVWCDDTRQNTQKSIDTGAAQLVQLEADIAKAQSDAEVLAQEIEGLQGEISKASGEADSAKVVRDKEHGDYLAQHQDYSESIDAIQRAVTVLKSKSADVPQSLAQLKSLNLLPAKAKLVVESFLSLHEETSDAPEANAYEFQSGGVVDLLEKLEMRFKDERLAMQKAELNAKHNHEMLLQQLTDSIKANTDTVNEKSAVKAGRMKDAASFKGDHEVTTKAKEGDEQTLSDTLTACHSRSAEFEQNQVTRAEELKAIKQAVEILSGDDVAGHAETYLPTLLQKNAKARALAQLRSVARKDDDVREHASRFLHERAEKTGSHYLLLIADRVAEDPFGKVKSMIKDLIVKLMEETNSEADHHAYCTAELATNKQTREDKSAEVEKLTAEQEGLQARAGQLADEIESLSDSIAELQGSRADATNMRSQEKETNGKTVADAKAAQAAVEQAISVLRSFYDKDSSGAAALLQKRASAREPYTGMGGDSTGVLGLLDVILSDFARLETETSSAEEQAASAYEKFIDESSMEIEVKDTTMKHKEVNKQQTEERLRSVDKELSLTQEELDAALTYYDRLKVDCVDTNLSYSDRVQMRKEEIQSLKEALRILNGEDTLV